MWSCPSGDPESYSGSVVKGPRIHALMDNVPKGTYWGRGRRRRSLKERGRFSDRWQFVRNLLGLPDRDREAIQSVGNSRRRKRCRGRTRCCGSTHGGAHSTTRADFHRQEPLPGRACCEHEDLLDISALPTRRWQAKSRSEVSRGSRKPCDVPSRMVGLLTYHKRYTHKNRM